MSIVENEISDVGARIRMRREFLGMSQEELALKIGYAGRSAVNKIETDVRKVKMSKLHLIAEALQTTVAYLMGWDEEETKVEHKVELSDTELKLLEYYRKLDQNGKDFVNSVMDREYDRCNKQGV